jgi:hypothetical protein
MVSELTATYRLVYFQPDPEDGERVCVALLFTAQRDVELLYDPEFPKLRCLAPRIDPALVRVYLDDMQTSARRGSSDVQSLLRRHAPQLVTSEARKSAWPLSDKARLYLIRRFLTKEGQHPDTLRKGTDKDEKIDQVKLHIKEFVLRVARRGVDDIKENASTQWVLGRNLPNIAPVAVALRKGGRIVILVDGVDLSVLTPKSALARVNKVTHTFWQYGRVRQMGIDNAPPRRIGLVLNGAENPRTAYRDTHDFALHQFKNEADLAVDASSVDDFRKFEEALQ